MAKEISAIDRILECAESHGLSLIPQSVELDELGTFFRVARGKSTDGASWVLREPKGPAAIARAENEHRALTLLGQRLLCAVPEWKIFSPELIAHPELPGAPLSPRTPAVSDSFIESVFENLLLVHGISAEDAQKAGLTIQSPEDLRKFYAEELQESAASFRIPHHWLTRWQSWIEDESFWPSYTVLVHGDLRAERLTMDSDGTLAAISGWGETHVGDPALDFAKIRLSMGSASLDALLSRYIIHESRAWPRMREHIIELATFLSRHQLRAAKEIELDPSAEPDEPDNDLNP